MPKMLIVDTYYPGALDAIAQSCPPSLTYRAALNHTMSWQFGTADFYSRHLREFGWEVQDVVVNSPMLQSLWAQEYGIPFTSDTIEHQIEAFQPDVLFLQDLGCLGSRLANYRNRFLVAGQTSCALRRELVPNFKVLFTSFPYYVRKYQNPYCKFVYNPLSFEPACIETIDAHASRPREFDISFVGGVGNPSHWVKGMDVLEAVAQAFPGRFKWWGYGYDTISYENRRALQASWQGYAWGKEMFQIYCNSKIVINRHGEISQGYANNMRMYEATGCGAMLLTEDKTNLRTLFDVDECAPYVSTGHAIELINRYLERDYERIGIAAAGQRRTTREHTYRERMKTVSDTLLEMLDGTAR